MLQNWFWWYQKLINAKDRGGLWRFNETVQNIFVEYEEIFCAFTSEFRLVFKYPELIQEMQAKSIIISNYDSLCYSIVPKVNKDLSLNLLESVLDLFVKVRMFLFSRDIKEKHKVKKKKRKARSLRTEIKKSFSSKDFNHWILLSIQFNLWPRNFKRRSQNGLLYSHPFKITLFTVKIKIMTRKRLWYLLTKISLLKQGC